MRHKASEFGAINPPKTKYGNHAVVGADGRRFDSKLELRYALQLDLEWIAKTIHWYTTQVAFRLEGGIRYVCDFLVVRNDPFRVQVVDCKGAMTQVSRNKMRQMQARYGIVVQVYRRDGSLTAYTEIPVTRKKRP